MKSDPDRHRGIYRKYAVERTDGSSDVGGKHHGCEYFVLDLTHDKYASAALLAYAEACRDTYPALAADLFGKIKDSIPLRGRVPDATKEDK